MANTHKDISVFKIVPPIWPDLPLSAYVPHIQLEALRLYAFDVKALERAETKPEHKLEWLDHVHKQTLTPYISHACNMQQDGLGSHKDGLAAGEVLVKVNSHQTISLPVFLGQGLTLSWLWRRTMQLVHWESSAGWVQEEVGELQIRRKQGRCEKQK